MVGELWVRKERPPAGDTNRPVFRSTREEGVQDSATNHFTAPQVAEALGWNQDHLIGFGRGPVPESARKFFGAGLSLYAPSGNRPLFDNNGRVTSAGREAILAFQRAHGIKDDGIIGPQTRTYMLADPEHDSTSYSGVMQHVAEGLYHHDGHNIPDPDGTGTYHRDEKKVVESIRTLLSHVKDPGTAIYNNRGERVTDTVASAIRGYINLSAGDNLTRADVTGLQSALRDAGFLPSNFQTNGRLNGQTVRALLRFSFINGYHHN
jgi:hypothetical protein